VARIKGVSVIELVKTLRKNRGVAETLVAPSLHAYLKERLLPSSWYPEEDYQALLVALGRMLRPLVTGDVWEFIGAQAAQQDLNGVYSILVRKGNPWGALHHANRIWSIYHDTGRMELVRTGPGGADIELHDYAVACPEICGTITGYLRELVVQCGAKDVECRLSKVQPPDEGPCSWSLRFRE
jgi:hypothetical protein